MNSINKVLSKKELIEFQREFKQIITRPLKKNDLMRSVQKSSFQIPNKKALSSKRQLEIYAQQYWWRIEGAFDEDFTTVRAVLSPSKYEALREEYLIKYPSRSYTLRDLGQFFVEFVSGSKTLSNHQKTLVKNAAMFDWARVVAFDAASYRSVTKDTLKNARFISQKLILQPYIQLLELDYPVQKINITSVHADQQSLSNVLTKKNVRSEKVNRSPQKIPPKKTFLAVHRFNEKIFFKELDILEYKILSLLQGGVSLQQLSNNSLMKKIPTAEWFLKRWNEWGSLDWICLKKK